MITLSSNLKKKTNMCDHCTVNPINLDKYQVFFALKFSHTFNNTNYGNKMIIMIFSHTNDITYGHISHILTIYFT